MESSSRNEQRRIQRVLLFFNKQDESLAGEFLLEGVKLEYLQNLFGVPEDDPMI